jgi:hypothetical protein
MCVKTSNKDGGHYSNKKLFFVVVVLVFDIGFHYAA